MNQDKHPMRVKTDEERRRAFFYAEASASLYDAAADLNTPLFSLMQQTIFELVRAHLDSNSTKQTPVFVLDIGSGTGSESISILQHYPNARVVAFDLCAPMHDIYRGKAEQALGKKAALERCQYITGDIASEQGEESKLRESLAQWENATQFDLIVSALALHHLTTEEKSLVYARLASVLAPNGLLINGDIFTFDSKTMAQQANQFGINWIKRQFSTPDPHLRVMHGKLGDRAKPMMDAWVDHYVNYNLPDPIESSPNGGPTTNRGQAEMLFDAGFREVACPFRYWEVGILWAKK